MLTGEATRNLVGERGAQSGRESARVLTQAPIPVNLGACLRMPCLLREFAGFRAACALAAVVGLE